MLVFGGWFKKIAYVAIGVDALILSKLQPRVVDCYGCHVETTSSNG
jgi:hypothetical protein